MFTDKIVDDLLGYKSVFTHNKKNKPDKRKIDIIFMKKQEFDIFYSGKYKYPLLVKETITINTGKTNNNEKIDRRLIVDPFAPDPELPSEKSFTLQDYSNYMIFGGSMGHNAPAGQHKTNINIYNETFLLSNISPEEIVHNTGLWALLENWCKILARNHKLYDITVFTGNIPDLKPANLNGTIMNIPIKMYKIVCFKHIDKPNLLFMDIFMTNNSPYYINHTLSKYSLAPYVIPQVSWEWFQNFTGIDLNILLTFYNLKNGLTQVKSFKKIIHTDIYLTESLKILMKKSNWFGYLAYSSNLQELENNWENCQKLAKEFENINFHRQYYELAKQRLQLPAINHTYIPRHRQLYRSRSRSRSNPKSKPKYKPNYKYNTNTRHIKTARHINKLLSKSIKQTKKLSLKFL